MFSNSRGIRHASDYAQRDLEVLLRIGRRTSQLTSRNFDVLLLQRGNHIGRRQLASRQLRRIKPYPHRVLALAEDDDIAHARNSLQRIFDVNVEIVRDVLVRKAVVGRDRNRRQIRSSDSPW